MLEYDRQSPAKSWVKLILSFLLIVLGTGVSVYFLCKIHWIFGVVIAIPMWTLLTDVIISRQKSVIWYLFDFIRYTLSTGGTAFIASFLWEINWMIGALSILPIFILLFFITGFLTDPLYYFSPESFATRKALKEFDKLQRDLENNDSTNSERSS